jgi:hypothetical protein
MANYSPYDYNYGDFADYQMPETEEERRRRLAAEAAARTPVKQVITTDPVTGEQNMTISGNVRDLGPENKLTPTLLPAGMQAAMPTGVDTGALFNRMIQQESGGRQYGPNGQILTSPRGALGLAQVMPATALNPGYGVRPATMAEISTPEGNRAFGERYFQGLLNYFGGDVTKATAAYNGGPGRVSRNTATNGGQLNVAQLPAETQQYLQAVRPTAAAQPVVTAAQLGSQTFPMTRGPAVPQTAAMSTEQVAAQPVEIVMSPAAPAADTGVRPGAVLGLGGTATQEGTAGEAVAQQAITAEHDRFVAAQDRPDAMVALAQDPGAQPWVRNLARDQVVENLTQAREKEKATREVEAARQDPNALARMLQAKSSEQGSWAKAMLFSILGMERSAADEAAKLGIGSKWNTIPTANGGSVLIKVRSDGIPLEGYDAATGKQLSSNELITSMGSGPGKVKPDVSMQDVEKGGQAGRVVTTYDQYNRPRTMVESGGQLFPYDTSWKPRSIAAAAAKLDYKVASDLYIKHNGNILDMLKEYQELKGPLSDADREAFIQSYGGGKTPIGTYKSAPVAPVASGGGGGGGGDDTEGTTYAGGGGGADQTVGTTYSGGAGGPVIPTTAFAPNSIAGIKAAQKQAEEEAKRAADEARAARELAAKEASEKRMAQLRKDLDVKAAAEKAPIEVDVAKQKEDITVKGKRSEAFNKHVDENISPDAIAGDVISKTRKDQFDMFRRPGVDAGKIFGIASGAGSTPGDQRWTIFRDVMLGKVTEPADKIRERAAALGLNPAEQSVVAEYAIANAEINSKTLKSTAGSSQVSDAEQKLNQARNVDITQVPMLGGYNAMAQSQFSGDLAKYKGDWAVDAKASNVAELEKLWRKEKQSIQQIYLDMAKQRLDYITKMGSTPAAIQNGYRIYPVPQYDPNANGGQGGWIKTKPLTSFNR